MRSGSENRTEGFLKPPGPHGAQGMGVQVQLGRGRGSQLGAWVWASAIRVEFRGHRGRHTGPGSRPAPCSLHSHGGDARPSAHCSPQTQG